MVLNSSDLLVWHTNRNLRKSCFIVSCFVMFFFFYGLHSVRSINQLLQLYISILYNSFIARLTQSYIICLLWTYLIIWLKRSVKSWLFAFWTPPLMILSQYFAMIALNNIFYLWYLNPILLVSRPFISFDFEANCL